MTYGRSTSVLTRLSKAEELHVIRSPNRHTMSNVLSIDTLNTRAIDSPCVSTLGVIGLCALWLVVVIAENASLRFISTELL
jgi:hypothetical protein